MNTRFVVITLALLSGLARGQVTASTAVEPSLNAPARFGVSAAIGVNVTEGNTVSFRYGSGRTMLGGVGRPLADLGRAWGAECRLVGDVQAGIASRRGVVVYGAAVATDVGQGASITYGIHINWIAGRPLYPSAYVSLGYSFGRYR
jgi:hypothetical protein